MGSGGLIPAGGGPCLFLCICPIGLVVARRGSRPVPLGGRCLPVIRWPLVAGTICTDAGAGGCCGTRCFLMRTIQLRLACLAPHGHSLPPSPCAHIRSCLLAGKPALSVVSMPFSCNACAKKRCCSALLLVCRAALHCLWSVCMPVSRNVCAKKRCCTAPTACLQGCTALSVVSMPFYWPPRAGTM